MFLLKISIDFIRSVRLTPKSSKLDIKKSKTPSESKRNKYNRQPKNIEVRRVYSPKRKQKNSITNAEQSNKFEYSKIGVQQQLEPNLKVEEDMKAKVK